MNVRRLVLLAIMVAVLALSPALASSVKIATQSAAGSGSEVVVRMSVDTDGAPLNSLDAWFTFDETQLDLMGVYKNSFTNSFSLVTNVQAQAGPDLIKVALYATASPPAMPDADKEVLWLQFRLKPGATSSAVHWQSADTFINDSVPTTFVDGTVSTATGDIIVSMPHNASAVAGGTTVVPIYVDSPNGLKSFDITVEFNPAVASALSIATTPVTAGMTLTSNVLTPGVARLSLFSTTPISATGLQAIATITFQAVGLSGTETPLDITEVLSDDGIDAVLDDGRFRVSPDSDGDGYTVFGGDCDDTNAAINPAAAEVCGDTIDNNCDGLVDNVLGTRYVATTGADGSNTCTTPASACLTIAHAVAVACAGETVDVGPGTFAENVVIGKPLTLLGEQAGVDARGRAATETIVTGTAPAGAFEVRASSVTIDGFTFSGTYQAVHVTSPAGPAASIVVRNNRVLGPSTNGINLWRASSATVERNYVQNVSTSGITAGDDAGTPATGDDIVTTATIRFNDVVNAAYGITGYQQGSTIEENSVHGFAGTGAALGGQWASTVVRNNHAYGYPSGAALAFAAYTNRPSSSGVTATGNVLTGSGYGVYVDQDVSSNTIHVNDNDLSGNLAAGSGRGGSALGTLDASRNWWGSSSPASLATLAGTGTDYTPWVVFGGDAAPLVVGFQPILSSLRVDDDSPQTGATPRIAEAIAGVDSAGTVDLAAGSYVENVVVNKPLTLTGAGAASTTIFPAVSSPNCGGSPGGSLCPGASNIVLVQANDVTVTGMTLDGDNPALTSSVVANGADLDARNGIIHNHAAGVYDNTVVHHVTVRNIYLRGIYMSSGGSNFNVHHNVVDNVDGENQSICAFNFGGSGIFADNTFDRCNDAVAANWSRGTQFLRNVVTNSSTGVHTDNAGDGVAPGDLIDSNQISACAANGYGIFTFVPYSAPTVSNNTITGCYVGLAQFGSRTDHAPVAPTLFSNNVIDGTSSTTCAAALYMTTDTLGYGQSDTLATMTGNTLRNCSSGVELAEGASTAFAVTLAGSGNTITTNDIGVNVPGNVAGGSVDLSGNNIFGNTLSGVTNASAATVTATCVWWGGAAVAPAVGPFVGNNTVSGAVVFNAPRYASSFSYTNTWYADGDDDGFGTGGGTLRCGPLVNTATGKPTDVLAGGDCNDMVAAINPAAFEACDGIDNNCVSGVDEFSGTRLVSTTGDDGSNACTASPCLTIGHAVLAACPSETISVGAGTFTEDVVLNKLGLSLVGAGIDQTIIVGTKTDGNPNSLTLGSSNLLVDGVTVTRQGNTVGEWNDPTLNNQGVVFGQLQINNTLRNSKVVHNRNGVYINNASGNTVRNCLIVENRTGVQFANVVQNNLFENNVIKDNNTLGVLFNNVSSVPYDATGTRFRNNDISGNWYGDVEARPNVGGTFVDVSGNWFGSSSIVRTVGGAGEPGYALLIPPWAGGAASPPVSAPDIVGTNATVVDYTPWLNVGTDTDLVTLGFQGDFSYLHVDDDSAQAGTVGRVQEGIDLVTAGGFVDVKAGTYTETASITKGLTLHGAGSATTSIDASSLASAGTVLSATGLSANVTIEGFTIKTGPASSVASNGIALSSMTGGTTTVRNNVITGVQSAAGTAQDNFGLIAQGSDAHLVFDANTVNGGGSNPVLLELWRGPVDFTNNTIVRGPDDTPEGKDAVFVMNYGATNITTKQRFAGNTFDMGGGTQFDNDHRGTGLSVVAQYTTGAGPGGYTDVEILDNQVVNLKPSRRGIGLWDNSNGPGDITAVIDGNTVTAAPSSTGELGIRVLGGITGTTITNNAVSGTGEGIRLRSWNGFDPQSASISGNTLTANAIGVRISEGTATVSLNSIAGNGTGLQNDTGTVTAPCDWWGASTGPNSLGADTTVGSVTVPGYLMANDFGADPDGDGYDSCTSDLGSDGFFNDCNNALAAINPGATDNCNGIDDNCDFISDNGPLQAGCDDGFWCNGVKLCSAGACTSPTAPCIDGNTCTQDVCNETGVPNAPTGTCDFTTPSGSCTIAGAVFYNKLLSGADAADTDRPVKDIVVRRTMDTTVPPNGTIDQTDDATSAPVTGAYAYLSASNGNVTLTPQPKTADPSELSASLGGSVSGNDATLVAQYAAGLTTLTPRQIEIADVSDNGRVTSFDASLIARVAVGLDAHFPAAGSGPAYADWAYFPVFASFTPITGPQSQDFVAALYGDVTLNWTPTGTPEAPGLPGREAQIDAPPVTTAAVAPSRDGASIYLASGPRPLGDGRFEIVLGLQNADGILALDATLVHDAGAIAVRGVRTTGIATGFTSFDGTQDGSTRVALFGTQALAGTGEFLVVTYDVLGPVAGAPFSVEIEANEGAIPVTWAPGLTRPAGTGPVGRGTETLRD